MTIVEQLWQQFVNKKHQTNNSYLATKSAFHIPNKSKKAQIYESTVKLLHTKNYVLN